MYEPKDFERKIGLEGFSEKMLRNHFTLYQGYVNNVNKIEEMLKTKEPGTPEYAELKRRFGWEFNGMRLHELYFENMTQGGTKLAADSELSKKIEKEWGSFEMWAKDFKSMGAMRGIGWIVLYFDPEADRLFNVWINEHDSGHLAGCVPILVMDVFEHAYMTDYEIKKADYIEAFMKVACFETAASRMPSAK
jgi:Fe-Mn family superoxide dismutase